MNRHNGTAWGQRFLQALEQGLEPKRLARGRQYSASHRVPDWAWTGGHLRFSGKNRGTAYYGMNEPIRFEGHIEISPLPGCLWQAVIPELGNQAGFIARLLLNEIPDSLESHLQARGHSLIPGRYGEDLQATCSCPETESPCRHVAAVLVALAARIDQTPLLLFELRGLNRATLAARLEDTVLGGIVATALSDPSVEPEPVTSYFTRPEPHLMAGASLSSREFWRAPSKLPTRMEPPQPSPVPGLLVKKGGDFPPFWQKDVSFIEVMDGFYEEVRRKAREWS